MLTNFDLLFFRHFLKEKKGGERPFCSVEEENTLKKEIQKMLHKKKKKNYNGKLYKGKTPFSKKSF
jgi:hypothetical protein